MNEEELAILRELILSQDPTAAAANDWGQGADYLTSPKKPTAFSRQGDMHQLYRNMFGMTGIDMESLVPNMYPVVEQPQDVQPYVSDSASLYAGNQAYDAVKELVDSGALSFEEAVSRAAADPELAQFLPKDDKGKPSLEAFRTGAANYVTEGNRAGREQSAFDAQQAAYEDYVRMRTGEDFTPAKVSRAELIASQIKPPTVDAARAQLPGWMVGSTQGGGPSIPGRSGPQGMGPSQSLQAVAQGAVSGAGNFFGNIGEAVSKLPGLADQYIGDPAERFGARLGQGFNPGEGAWDMEWNNPNAGSRPGVTQSRFDPTGPSPKVKPSKAGSKVSGIGSQVAKAAGSKGRNDKLAQDREATRKMGNAAELAAYDNLRMKLALRPVQSKEQENQQRLIAFYNQLMRQGG